MPARSKSQKKGACAEYGRRKKGQKGGKNRPFGTASTQSVRDFCVMPVRPKGKHGRSK